MFSSPPALPLLQGHVCEFILYTKKWVVLGLVGDLDCMAVLYICAPAAELWLLLLHMLLQTCARTVEPRGSTAFSMILGMLCSCPRMVDPSDGVGTVSVWYGTWYGTLCGVARYVISYWYGMMVRFVWWIQCMEKSRYVIRYICGMV